jgi:hypothetical protein
VTSGNSRSEEGEKDGWTLGISSKLLIFILTRRERRWSKRVARFERRCETIHDKAARAERESHRWATLNELSYQLQLKLHDRNLRRLNTYSVQGWEHAIVILFFPAFLASDLLSVARSHRIDTAIIVGGGAVAIQSWIWASLGVNGIQSLFSIWSDAIACVFFFAFLLHESRAPGAGLIRKRHVANMTLTAGLFIVLAVWLAIWAQADWRVSATTNACFTVRLTHTDSIYYTVTNFTTLGAGAIRPISQSCERLVSVQSASNWIVIVAFISIALSRLFLTRRATENSTASDPSEIYRNVVGR